jgi:hypothetical protein
MFPISLIFKNKVVLVFNPWKAHRSLYITLGLTLKSLHFSNTVDLCIAYGLGEEMEIAFLDTIKCFLLPILGLLFGNNTNEPKFCS